MVGRGEQEHEGGGQVRAVKGVETARAESQKERELLGVVQSTEQRQAESLEHEGRGRREVL